MLSLALTTLLALSCGAESNWWETEILYQIYPRSFADSDGDGNGDLRGIKEHVDYLSELGIGVVWLSPIYDSPWEDMGYDISNFKDIHPVFGTLEDFKDLVKAVHEHGLKLLLDLVSNHSSDKHPWFVESRKSANNTYSDFYVWKDPKGWDDGKPVPPNNWISEFGGSAWKYVPERKQFYLHQFGPYQPDLNFENPKVVEAIKDVMKFWLDLGVDGFRVDAVPFLSEDPEFRDEPYVEGCEPKTDRKCLQLVHIMNQPGAYKLLAELDEYIHEFDSRYMFLEGYGEIDTIMRYYNNLSAPFNFELLTNFKKDTDATRLKEIIDTCFSKLPPGKPINWVVGNHDQSRVASRVGPELVDAVNMLVLLLPGVGVTYQGEEIGMSDVHLRKEQKSDDRDAERSPFQWDNTRNAGFTKGNHTWLPVNPDFWKVNVVQQRSTHLSHLYIYQQLAQLRRQLTGPAHTATLSPWVFAFQREGNQKNYYVLINLNNIEEEVSLSSGFQNVPSTAVVEIPSENSALNQGEVVFTENIVLRPRSGLVIST